MSKKRTRRPSPKSSPTAREMTASNRVPPPVTHRLWSRGVRPLLAGGGRNPDGIPQFSKMTPAGAAGLRYRDWLELSRRVRSASGNGSRHEDWGIPFMAAASGNGSRHEDFGIPFMAGASGNGSRHEDFGIPFMAGASGSGSRHEDFGIPFMAGASGNGSRHEDWMASTLPGLAMAGVAEFFGDVEYIRSLRGELAKAARGTREPRTKNQTRGSKAKGSLTAAAKAAAALLPAEGGELLGVGYIPDRSDNRDYGIEKLVANAHRDCPHTRAYKANRQKGPDNLPNDVDLRDACAVPMHQGALQNCTAHAVLAMAEYHLGVPGSAPPHGRAKGQQPPPPRFSRLFLYKVARELLGVQGDVGCTLRETVKAMRNYGCVSDAQWPARPWNLERMPEIQDLEDARLKDTLDYCRLDGLNNSGDDTLMSLLHSLADGFPVAFGFSLFDNLDEMQKENTDELENYVIPLPNEQTRVLGGHAVLAVGYRIRKKTAGPGLQGEVLIRNSWGPDWGDKGHAWLPFEYITLQYSFDFWAQYRTNEPAKSVHPQPSH